MPAPLCFSGALPAVCGMLQATIPALSLHTAGGPQVDGQQVAGCALILSFVLADLWQSEGVVTVGREPQQGSCHNSDLA